MGFSDELWDGFEKVTERVTQGKKFTAEFKEFTKKRIEIERDYAKKLQSLIKSTKITEIGTLDTAWNTLKTETESIASYHQTFADTLSSQVDDSLKQWLGETQKQRKALRSSGKKLLGDFTSAQGDVEKSKGGFEKCRKKQDATQTESNNDSSNQKLAKRLLSETKASEKADEAYKKSVEKMKVMEGRFYDSELPQILKDYEALENARVKLLKGAISSFVDAQASIPPKAKNSCEVMKAKADGINVDADIQTYITSVKTGQSKPARTQYQAYDSALGACKPPAGGGGGGGGGLSFSAPASTNPIPTSTISPPKGPTLFTSAPKPGPSFGGPSVSPRGGGDFSKPAPSHSASNSAGSFKVKALYAYSGTEDTELSFEEGDIITVTYRDESGWWEGELNGQVGVFPSNHVEEIGKGGGGGGGGGGNTAAAAPAYEEAFDKCKALYEYKAEDPDELTIREGDILTIDDEDDEGWYYGTNAKGEYGKFPSNYVELLPK